MIDDALIAMAGVDLQATHLPPPDRLLLAECGWLRWPALHPGDVDGVPGPLFTATATRGTLALPDGPQTGPDRATRLAEMLPRRLDRPPRPLPGMQVCNGTDLVGAGRSLAGPGSAVAPLGRILERINDLETRLAQAEDAIGTLRSRLAAAERHAATDALTGIANRRAFLRCLRSAVGEAKERRQPLSLLMIDIDHFKSFNDDYGHGVGDHVLRLVATALSRVPGGSCHTARWGGEEFTVLLPRTALGDAVETAQRLRRSIATRRFVMRGTGDVLAPITISIGVAGSRPNESGKQLVRRADAALYRAKRAGRNRVVADGEARRDHPRAGRMPSAAAHHARPSTASR